MRRHRRRIVRRKRVLLKSQRLQIAQPPVTVRKLRGIQRRQIGRRPQAGRRLQNRRRRRDQLRRIVLKLRPGQRQPISRRRRPVLKLRTVRRLAVIRARLVRRANRSRKQRVDPLPRHARALRNPHRKLSRLRLVPHLRHAKPLPSPRLSRSRARHDRRRKRMRVHRVRLQVRSRSRKSRILQRRRNIKAGSWQALQGPVLISALAFFLVKICIAASFARNFIARILPGGRSLSREGIGLSGSAAARKFSYLLDRKCVLLQFLEPS